MIEAHEVQGNVLYAYGDPYPYARYVLLAIKDPAAARARLRGWSGEVTFGRRPWDAPPPFHPWDGASPGAPDPLLAAAGAPAGDVRQPHLNVAFTFAGLRALGVPPEFLCAFADEFREGAANRSAANGDLGDGAKERWMTGFGAGHVLLIAHGATREGTDEFVRRLTAGVEGAMTRLHELPAARLAPRRYAPAVADQAMRDPQELSCSTEFDVEHFGFADGCSQPAIEGVHDDPVGDGIYAMTPPKWWRPVRGLELMLQDLGLREVGRQWRTVRAGEFLLGYENEDGHLPPGPPAPLGPNGTFMVYRPIEQHVEAFDAYVDGEARRLGLQAELVRAKIIGRWPDGTPLTISPERPDSTVATNRRRANDFLYQEQDDAYRGDADGYGCPLGAHIRRSNPRDALPGGGERTMRHRIIRRGMPYGPRDGSEERGLAFVCYGASISDGFEFIQRNWCNGGASFGLGSDRDLLLQQAGPGDQLTGMAIPMRDNGTVVLQPPPRALVTVRGCEYLFLPSRRALSWLANLQ